MVSGTIVKTVKKLPEDFVNRFIFANRNFFFSLSLQGFPIFVYIIVDYLHFQVYIKKIQ